MPEKEAQYVSLPEAAERFGITVNTLREILRGPGAPRGALLRVGRNYRVDVPLATKAFTEASRKPYRAPRRSA